MKGKDSFVFHMEWKVIFDDCDIEEAGVLIKTILSYCNDENPDEVVLEKGIRRPFLSIKNRLKSDLDKWKQTIEKQSFNGKKGGAPKGNNNARKNNPKQPKTTQNNPNKPIDIDIDIDIDNVIDNDIDLKNKLSILDLDQNNLHLNEPPPMPKLWSQQTVGEKTQTIHRLIKELWHKDFDFFENLSTYEFLANNLDGKQISSILLMKKEHANDPNNPFEEKYLTIESVFVKNLDKNLKLANKSLEIVA